MKSKLFTVGFLFICFMIGLSVTAKGQYYDNYQYQLYQAQQQLLYQQYLYRQMLIQQQYQLNQQGQQLMQQATNPSTPNYNIDWDAWFKNYSETNQSNSGQYQSTDYNSNSANQGQYQNSNSSSYSSNNNSSSYSSYTPSSSSNNNSGGKTKMTCEYCNGTGRVRHDLNPPRFGYDDPHEGEKCPECGEANYGSLRHSHIYCGHCGGKGYYYL